MDRDKVIAIAAAGAFVVSAALGAWFLRSDGSAGPCVVATGPGRISELPESSGLAVSRRNPGLIWSHNDSGSAAVLFGLDTEGAVRARVRVPIRTRDWEDVSAARCPSGDCLYIADIGDNKGTRPKVQI
jgi:hypothetical protein